MSNEFGDLAKKYGNQEALEMERIAKQFGPLHKKAIKILSHLKEAMDWESSVRSAFPAICESSIDIDDSNNRDRTLKLSVRYETLKGFEVILRSRTHHQEQIGSYWRFTDKFMYNVPTYRRWDEDDDLFREQTSGTTETLLIETLRKAVMKLPQDGLK